MQADPLQVPREPVYVIAHVLGEKVHAPHVITKADAPNVYDWFPTVVTVVVGGSHGSVIVSTTVVDCAAIAEPPGVTADITRLRAPACEVFDKAELTVQVRATLFTVTAELIAPGIEDT